MTTSPSNDDASSHGARAVRALLERQGIPKHRHSSFVGEFFALSRAAAHQRVSKSTAWTLEELGALAEHFGETLVDVVAPVPPAKPTAVAQGIDATLRAGAVSTSCRIWLRIGDMPSPYDAFVALRDGNEYTVVPLTMPLAAHAQRIARIEIEQPASPVRRVAVFDADRQEAAALCAQLNSIGMHARSFVTATDLLEAIAERGFDGYVIDWPVPGDEVHTLLSAVRAQAQPCALVLLSGRMRAAPETIADLAQAVGRYKAHFLEKPVPAPLIVSALQSGFAA